MHLFLFAYYQYVRRLYTYKSNTKVLPFHLYQPILKSYETIDNHAFYKLTHPLQIASSLAEEVIIPYGDTLNGFLEYINAELAVKSLFGYSYTKQRNQALSSKGPVTHWIDFSE